MLSQAVQDYLKTIYKIEEQGKVTTTKVSKEMNVSGASVTGMIKRLATMGFVEYTSYKGVKLTENGKKIALEIVRHHRLLELYLKEMLGFSLEKVHDEACRLEHYISEEFLNKIDDLLGNPEFDPHGHPIPTRKGTVLQPNEVTLFELPDGAIRVISKISDEDPEMLAYFEKMGLMPNVKVKLISKEPFSGPVTIEYDGNSKIIGSEVAKSIYVNNE